MKSLVYLPGIMIVILIFQEGVESVENLGATSGTCANLKARDQLCPTNGVYKYVRIKTYNGKYWHATPSEHCWQGEDSLCVKTRCCGAKPSVDQSDIKEPGRRTIFRVHCMTVTPRSIGRPFDTIILEVLNTNNNNPSGYYLCTVEKRSDVFTKRLPGGIWDGGMKNCRWILHQWRGSVIGIEPMYVWKWTTFDDGGYGLIRHGHKYSRWWKTYHTGTHVRDRETPHLADTYTLEIVPKECLDVADSQKIKAGPDDVTPKDCEENSDKCFMNNGLRHGHNHPSGVPKCFYRRDSMCFQTGSRQPCDDGEASHTAEQCENTLANCCYDYSNNECYKAKSFV